MHNKIEHEGARAMTNLHTDPKLLAKLEESATRQMSEDEIRKQRVSYVMGMLKEDSRPRLENEEVKNASEPERGPYVGLGPEPK